MTQRPSAQSSFPTEPSPGLRRSAVRSGTVAALGFLSSQAISFTSFIVLARLAPPATFGAYAAASILIGAGGLLTEGGMQSAVIQRRDRLQEAASTAFIANLVGGVVLAALAAGFAPIVGLFFHSGEVARAAAVLAATIPLNAIAIVPGALLQRRFSFRFALLGPLTAIAYASAAITTLALGFGLWGLVAATLIASAVRTSAVWALCRWRPTFALISRETWRELSRYGRPVVLSAFLREAGLSGTAAVVGRALGTSALGRFRYAQRLVLQLNSAIIFGAAYVLLPAFSRISQDQRRLQDAILRAISVLTLITFPLSLIFIPLGRPIATILLGREWRAAGPILMALAGVGIAMTLDSISSEVFKATGRTDILPRLHGLTAILPIALIFPLLRFGATGAGVALSLGMCMVAAYAIDALGRISNLPLRRILGQVWPALSSAVLMAGGLLLFDRYLVHAERSTGATGLYLLALDFAVAAVLYLCSLLVISRESITEMLGLAKLLVTRTEG